MARAKKENRTVLAEIEAGQLMMQLGINCMDTHLTSTKERAVVLDPHMVLSAAKTPN